MITPFRVYNDVIYSSQYGPSSEGCYLKNRWYLVNPYRPLLIFVTYSNKFSPYFERMDLNFYSNLLKTGNSSVSFSIFPNPTENCFTISARDIARKNAAISIYDIIGNSVLESNLDKDLKNIFIENFSSGIYFIKVTDKG
jgi:hypothetical protein